MIRAKVLRRKYSKRLSKLDLKATFSDKTELKSNDLRIRVLCFGKALYRLHVYSRNPRDETRTESKQTKTYNLGQNLLRHITKIPIFFALTLTKMLIVANLKTVSPLPYCNVVYGNRRNAHVGC